MEQLEFFDPADADWSQPWYCPAARNPVDQVIDRIIADPATRFSAWCAAQELRERRRQERMA